MFGSVNRDSQRTLSSGSVGTDTRGVCSVVTAIATVTHLWERIWEASRVNWPAPVVLTLVCLIQIPK